ncbi:M48 family metallopeptidase [uncultured Rikenella sp.]|uniref:M48 family metallopeptidase n=1 Tax=uncultured Rikenella sp. TaxID=368003 RepID=UPI00262EAF88|nr:M48 family metallopeptidase [uncultured Rikenella sp.]
MKRILTFLAVAALSAAGVSHAQFRLNKAIGAGAKVLQAATLTDAQIKGYVKEYIDWMDAHNPVCEGDDEFAVRLARITAKINVDGLNIKAYRVRDVNAFACADGSIRVFAGLMQIMTDEEILGVIGHEIGHVMNKDSKDAFRTALLASALRDGVSSAGGTAAKLSDSQLGDLGEAVTQSKFSQKQEYAADEYGYNFLKSHGENPWAMALSFEKLKKMEEEMGADKTNKVQQLFSTHPDLDNRIKRMTDKATADGFERPEMTAPETAAVE